MEGGRSAVHGRMVEGVKKNVNALMHLRRENAERHDKKGTKRKERVRGRWRARRGNTDDCNETGTSSADSDSEEEHHRPRRRRRDRQRRLKSRDSQVRTAADEQRVVGTGDARKGSSRKRSSSPTGGREQSRSRRRDRQDSSHDPTRREPSRSPAHGHAAEKHGQRCKEEDSGEAMRHEVVPTRKASGCNRPCHKHHRGSYSPTCSWECRLRWIAETEGTGKEDSKPKPDSRSNARPKERKASREAAKG